MYNMALLLILLPPKVTVSASLVVESLASSKLSKLFQSIGYSVESAAVRIPSKKTVVLNIMYREIFL